MENFKLTQSILDVVGNFVSENPLIFSFTISCSVWLLCMAFSIKDIEKASRQTPRMNITTIPVMVGVVMTSLCFMLLLIYSFMESKMHFVFSGIFMILVYGTAFAIASFKLDEVIKENNEAKPEEEFDIRHVLHALNDCVKQAFGTPHFVSSSTGSFAGHTIFMNSNNGCLYGVVNHADHTIKPESIAMGDIHLCSNQGTAAPDVLCYICGLHLDGKHYDIVMNYSNRVNPIDPKRDVDLIRVMRYKLLNVMKADSVMSKIILN